MKMCESIKSAKSIVYFNNLEDKFNAVHNNKYDYSKVVFVSSRTKIIITCPTHGDFEQQPYSHLSGIGCRHCGIKRRTEKLILPFKGFIEKANLIHNFFYIYNEADYTNTCIKTIIICPIHGKFKQSPSSHMNGRGCPKCSLYKNKDVRRSTTEQFVEKAVALNKDRYDYSKVIYKFTDNPVTIICPEHGEFQQTPHDHISKQAGCPKCSIYGFKKDKPAILYYIKILKDGKIYYKVGVTNNSLKTRFKADMKYITAIQIKQFKTGQEAYIEEQRIIKQYYSYKHIGENVLTTNGNTELFIKDVLNLDNKKDKL